MARSLTKQQIEEIINGMHYPYPQGKIRHELEKNLRRRLRKELSTVKLIPKLFPAYKDEVVRQFYHALVPPGEMVGTLAAQAIAQPTTQLTLNSFHLAGVTSQSTVTGVPRISEILNATKNPRMPCMTVYLKDAPEFAVVYNFAYQRLLEIKLEDVVQTWEIVKPKKPSWWRSIELALSKLEAHGDTTSWILRVTCDREKLYRSRLSLQLNT